MSWCFAILTYLPLGGFGWALTSCSSYIEEETDGLATEEKVGDSTDAMNYWVTGTYSKWVYDMFCWGYFPRVLEFDADYISGPDWLFGKFGVGNFQGEADVTDALWKGCYGLIERANNAIRHIDAMENITLAEKNNAIGEMEFHKAMGYFLLVRAYGAVPILPLEENANFDYNNERQPVEKVWSEIFELLEDAALKMYNFDNPNYVQGHVSAGSAAGLLVKALATAASYAMPNGTPITVRNGHPYEVTDGAATAYAPLKTYTFTKGASGDAAKGYDNLNAESLYAKAASWGRRLIEENEFGNYSLVESFEALWSKSNRYAPEFMFSIYVPSNDPKFKTSIHTQYEGYYTAPGSDFIQSGGWVGCTRHWYALFDSDDDRIVKGVKHRWRSYNQEAWNTGYFYPEDYKDLYPEMYDDGVDYEFSYDSYHLAYTTKYMDVSDNAIENADTPWPFLRLADVYLMYAEALNETGNTAEAEVWLKKVRERSNATSTTITDRDEMRSAIIEERAKELACEADRRWDLIRWGIYLQAMNDGFDASSGYGSDDGKVLKNRQAKHLLYPIPNQELNINKAITENNPGWN